jgi:hypothetical protein
MCNNFPYIIQLKIYKLGGPEAKIPLIPRGNWFFKMQSTDKSKEFSKNPKSQKSLFLREHQGKIFFLFFLVHMTNLYL